MKHTSGSWKAEGTNITAPNTHIANVSLGRANTPYVQLEDEEMANIKLISAAPDMLEVLGYVENMLGVFSDNNWLSKDDLDIYLLVKETIKKATI